MWTKIAQHEEGIDSQRILETVKDAILPEFEMPDWEEMIDNINHLSSTEKEWAKENLSITIEIIGK